LVKNKKSGRGLVYNYGTFTFSSPNLVSDFLNRRLNYWLSTESFEELVEGYSSHNRTILEQELSLSEAQALELARFLANNALPQNRYYAYDYYTDNCSTRVRDALDRVLGGALKAAAGPSASQTYREHSLRLTADDLPLYVGLDFGLSGYADQAIGEWEEAFLPEKLAELARRVRITNEKGESVPLVRAEKVHFRAERSEPLATPPPRTLAFGATGVVVGAALAWLGRRRAVPQARLLHASILILIGVVVGTGSSLLTFLWLGTPHTAAARNLNLLVAPPWTLLLVPLGTLLYRRHARAEHLTRWLSGALAAGAFIAFILVLAGVQRSERFVALLLPIWLGTLAAFVDLPRLSRAGESGALTK
jgi:hypothetical protein